MSETVVVTGGTRGLGRAIALDFLERGARVHATYHANAEAARAFADECARFDGRLALHAFDVADHAAVAAFWDELERTEEGGVQVLVNNSGIRRDALLALTTPEDWDRVLATNLTGCYAMCKHALRLMLPRRYGRIVLVTSPAGRFGFEGQASYAASKAGQVGLMRALAREVGTRKITVNCISPGFIDTELIADLPEETRKKHLELVPLKRYGRPEEVAYAVRFLCAPEASYVHGTTLEVTGGL